MRTLLHFYHSLLPFLPRYNSCESTDFQFHFAVMASAEQPLKKRKLYEQFTQPSPSTPPHTPPAQPPLAARPPAEPLTQEDILRRQRNVEEIGRVYNCLKKIKACLAKDKEQDPRRMPELEQAYLYLITASRGCTSVQRIVADLIPRYAAYCPTALEAAAKVVINMHNCNQSITSGGGDYDGISFDSAVACIFGLVDISQTAAKEAPTSSVIQGICSAVFFNVFTFLISSFEGKDIFQIVDKKILEVLDAKDFITDFKQKSLDKGDSALLELLKCRVASFLKVFHCFPKHSLDVCFELLASASDTTQQHGYYFLRQLTNRLSDYVYHISPGDEDKSGSKSKGTSNGNEGNIYDGSNSNCISKSASPVSWNCILGQVLDKDISLRHWILSRYKTLCNSASHQVVSHVTSLLDDTFGCFTKQFGAADTDGDACESGAPKYSNPHLFHGELNLETSIQLTEKDGSVKVNEKSSAVSTADFHDLHLKESSSFHSSVSSMVDTGGSRSMDIDTGGPGNTSHSRSVTRELLSQQNHSPIPRTPLGPGDAYHGMSVPRELSSKQIHSPVTRTRTDLTSSFQVPRDKNQVSANIMLHERANAGSTAGSGSSHFAINVNESTQGQEIGSPSNSYTARMAHLSSMILSLRAKYNFTPILASSGNRFSENYHVTLTKEEERYSTNILRFSIPNTTPMFLTDDELFSVCNLAISNSGSIVRLTRTNIPMGSSWIIECNTTDTAKTILKNLRSCPGIFVQIEFSHHVKQQSSHFPVKLENRAPELVSPRESPGFGQQVGHAFQSNQAYVSYNGVPEWEFRNIDRFMDRSRRGGHATAEQTWMHTRPTADHRPEAGGFSCIPAPTPGTYIAPPPAVKSLPFRAVNITPHNPWDARFGGHPHVNPVSSGLMHGVRHNPMPPQFVPVSVTPLAQFHGTSRPVFSQMFSVPLVGPPFQMPPMQHTQPELQPPPPSSQPPPPHSQPPFVPPPPSSPPPPSESNNLEFSLRPVQHQWQGVLSKSGVHYCTVVAERVDSDSSKYLDNVAEPAEWPSKLDITKRTDFRHVRMSFSNTLPNKREICWLFPSSEGDHTGFQDFISYLQQRECAGVIRIPAVKSMWPRLLFILPCSPDTCSMLSIAPNPSPCLVGLVLPKETNCEWV